MNPRYELQGELGQGGSGTVFKAWDKRLQRFVAIKILLPPEQRGQGQSSDELIAEAAALSALQHPNVVSIFDVEPDEELGAYVVMEYLNGENLEQIVQKGPLEVSDFQEVAVQTLTGVNAAHKMGVQHRDIKPGNVMINWLPDGRFAVKVLDFGLAKFTARPSRQTAKSNGTEILGSVHFMAPEQFSNRPLDQRSDLYSLGCLFYYALTSRRPFDGATLTEVITRHQEASYAPLLQLRPSLPPLLCEWVQWLMKKYPEERPRTAELALEVLEGIRSGALTELPAGLRTARMNFPAAQAVKPEPEPEIVVAAMKPGGERERVQPGPPQTGSAHPGGYVPAIPITGARPPPRKVIVPQVPPRAAAPPAAGKAAHAPAASRKSAGTRKSAAPWIMGGSAALAALAAVAGAIVYFKRDDDTRKPGEKPRTAADLVEGMKTGSKPAETKTPPAGSARKTPPGNALTIWCQSGQEVFGSDGKTPAAEGGTVYQWGDLEPQKGSNPPQYIGSTSVDKEKRVPLLRTVIDASLAGGKIPALAFNGQQNLVIRDRDKIGDPLGDVFDKDGLTVGLSFRVSSSQQTQRLVSAESGEHGAWEVWIENGKLYAGKASADKRTEGLALPAGRFAAAVAVFHFDRGKCQLFLADDTGIRTSPEADFSKPGPFEMIRLGLPARPGPAGNKDGFNGEMTELLIYRHPLPADESTKAASYLYERLYGEAPPGA